MSTLVRADLVAARNTALQMRQAAQTATLPHASRLPERILGYVSMLEGDLAAAEMHFDTVLDGYAPEGHDPILPGHPFDVLASTLSQRAILSALQDRRAAMELDFDHALRRARSLDSPPTHFQVLVHLCIALFELRDFDRLPPLMAELRDVVDRNEITPLYADLWEAWLTARNGALDEGLASMQRAHDNGAQYPIWQPSALRLAVELLRDAGRARQALDLLDECEARIERHRHTYLLAETRRLRGLCLHDLGAEAAEVVSHLDAAIATARRQGAARFEAEARRALDEVRQNIPARPVTSNGQDR
jgi:hypothetical protein